MFEFPFGLPLELCEIIFNYLNVKDLLCCALVSKLWCEFIGRNCMKKILIKIDDKTCVKDVLSSERIYKRGKLMRLSKDKFSYVIAFLSSTVVELELEECEGHEDEENIFPNLKELTLSCCSSDILKSFNSRFDKLKILHLYQLHGPTQNIHQFLKNNDKIEELNLYMNDSSCFFDDDTLSKDLNLHLKSIFISYKSNNELHASTLANIEKFLISQGDRLEIISLINSANLLLLFRIWNCMKAVKRFYFFSTDPFFDYCDESISSLKYNVTLEELELHSLAPYPFSLDDIRPFIDASKINSLAVWHLRKDIAEYGRQNKNLKSISYVTADDDCRIYLKSKNGINEKIRFHQYLV